MLPLVTPRLSTAARWFCELRHNYAAGNCGANPAVVLAAYLKELAKVGLRLKRYGTSVATANDMKATLRILRDGVDYS